MNKIDERNGKGNGNGNVFILDYLPPKMTVIEVKMRSMLCVSESFGGGSEANPYHYGSGDGI